MAALLLLERLSPLERAVFVLREVFGFGFPEVAAAVGRSGGGVPPARRPGRDATWTSGAPGSRRTARNARSWRRGSSTRSGRATSDGLRELLAADVQMVGDGGGKAPAFASSVIGADNVARVLASVLPLLARIDARVEPRELNGQPGAILRDRDGKVAGR